MAHVITYSLGRLIETIQTKPYLFRLGLTRHLMAVSVEQHRNSIAYLTGPFVHSEERSSWVSHIADRGTDLEYSSCHKGIAFICKNIGRRGPSADEGSMPINRPRKTVNSAKPAQLHRGKSLTQRIVRQASSLLVAALTMWKESKPGLQICILSCGIYSTRWLRARMA